MKKKVLLGIIVLVLIAGILALNTKAVPNKNIASAESSEMNHTISVSGEGIVEVAPDISYINFGITKQAKSAAEAMDELSTVANRVVTTLKNFGLKESDIRTTGISLVPVYQWDKENKKNILVGYSATENFRIRVNLKDTGRIIGLITENGINKIYGISFDSSKRDELKTKAISNAVEDARKKAEASLEGTDYKIVGIKTISIQSGYITPIYRNIAGKEEAGTSVPIEGGSMNIRATVQVVFIFD